MSKNYTACSKNEHQTTSKAGKRHIDHQFTHHRTTGEAKEQSLIFFWTLASSVLVLHSLRLQQAISGRICNNKITRLLRRSRRIAEQENNI
jgi:hypothetical protein